MEIAYSTSFKRAFKRKTKQRQELQDKFFHCLNLFLENPFHHQLKTHKLTGNLKKYWSFSIEYDVRVVFAFAEDQTKVILIDIGSHDEVY